MKNVVTEIRSFYSIKEITEAIEEEIDQYKSVADEYSQWLGSLLRDLEETSEDEEWFKKMATLQKSRPKGKAKPTQKKEKVKKKQASVDWVQLRELGLSASEQSVAEILFEAIEKINTKIERLEKVKESLLQLEKSGLGKDITYITYICDGVPEKIVLRHKKEEEFAKKFQYIADFLAVNVT